MIERERSQGLEVKDLRLRAGCTVIMLGLGTLRINCDDDLSELLFQSKPRLTNEDIAMATIARPVSPNLDLCSGDCMGALNDPVQLVAFSYTFYLDCIEAWVYDRQGAATCCTLCQTAL